MVGVYVGTSKLWYQVSEEDGVLRSWNVELPASRVRITGTANLDNVAYCSLDIYPSENASSPGTPVEHGVYVLKLGQDSIAAWLPVAGTVGPYSARGSVTRLIGSNISSLVFMRHLVNEEVGDRILYWRKPSL